MKRNLLLSLHHQTCIKSETNRHVTVCDEIWVNLISCRRQVNPTHIAAQLHTHGSYQNQIFIQMKLTSINYVIQDSFIKT